MSDRIAALLEDRLAVPGRGLEEKLRRGGRRLPRKVRAAAQVLVEADGLAGHPKLAATLDQGRLAAAYQTCHAHLARIGGRERAKTAALGVTGTIVVRLLIVAGLGLSVAMWRGLI